MEKLYIKPGIDNKGAAYWMDLQHFNDEDPFFLAQVQKGINNFVRILTEKNIPVQYATSGDSLTDGKTVYISSNLKEDTIDSTVGLALHEASHILLTDFDFLRKENGKLLEYTYKVDKSDIDNVFNLINFIEDKRIDNFIYTTSPGYQYYYEQMYNKYYYNNIIDTNLQKDIFITPTWEAYLFRIINIFNKNSNLKALPELQTVYDVIDIKNIDRLKSTKDSVEVAIAIYNIIKPYIVERDKPLSNQEYKTREHVDRQKNFINSDYRKKRVSKEIKKTINQLSNSSTSLKHTIIDKSTTYPVIVTDDWMSYFATTRINLDSVVDKGFHLGKVLLKNLRIRNSISSEVFENQEKGKLYNKKLFQAPFNNNIFYKIEKEKYKKVFIHISLDLSGSMRGKKLTDTVQTAISIAYASCYLDNLDVEISFRGTNRFNSNNIIPVLAYAFNSKKHKVHHLKNFKYLLAEGYTPEGICLNEIKYTLPTPNFYQDVYLLNISDGMPNINSPLYNTSRAIKHTKNVINRYNKNGVGIISFYVKDVWDLDKSSEENFKKMYGNKSQFIDINNISLISKSINRLLISNKIKSF